MCRSRTYASDSVKKKISVSTTERPGKNEGIERNLSRTFSFYVFSVKFKHDRIEYEDEGGIYQKSK